MLDEKGQNNKIIIYMTRQWYIYTSGFVYMYIKIRIITFHEALLLSSLCKHGEPRKRHASSFRSNEFDMFPTILRSLFENRIIDPASRFTLCPNCTNLNESTHLHCIPEYWWICTNFNVHTRILIFQYNWNAWSIFKVTNLGVYTQILMYIYESWCTCTNLALYIWILINIYESWCIYKRICLIM